MCPSLTCAELDSRLDLLFVGQLSESERSSITDHLDSCPRCAETFHAEYNADPLVSAIRVGLPRVLELCADSDLQRLKDRIKDAQPGGETNVVDHSRPTPSPIDEEYSKMLGPAESEEELGRLGKFGVLRVAGAGGMGVVFVAVDTQLERRVALKVMKPALAASSSSARKRFSREAQAMARLDHDHIVTVFENGEVGDVPYFAMPLLEGESLRDRLRREPRLPFSEVVRIGREIVEGLAVAHERRLIHRDVKPGNIFLVDGTHVKLLDFGLVYGLSEDGDLTPPQAVLGTPNYMSPEQAMGRDVDSRSDLYSLGVVLYQMSSGALPFEARDTLELLKALATLEPTPLHEHVSGLPESFYTLVSSLLARDPKDRPRNADEVGSALKDWVDQSVPSPEPSTLGFSGELISATADELSARSPRGRWTRVVWFGVPGGVILMFLAIVFLWSGTGSLLLDPVGELPPPRKKEVPGNHPKVLGSVKSFKTRPILRPAHESFAECIAFHPNSKTLASGGRHGIVKIWDVKTGKELHFLNEHKSTVQSVAFSFDGKLLASGDDRGTIHLWNPTTGKKLRSLKHGFRISKLAFSPVQNLLASVGSEKTVLLWDTDEGKVHRTFAGHSALIQAVAFRADGKRLVSVGDDRRAIVWDVETGDEVCRFIRHTAEILCVAFRPDGKQIASGCKSRTVHVWNAETGKEDFSYKRHPYWVTSLAYHPGGEVLASITTSPQEGNNVVVTDAKTGEATKHSLRGPWLALCIRFSPDGRVLACSGGAHGKPGEVRLWSAIGP